MNRRFKATYILAGAALFATMTSCTEEMKTSDTGPEVTITATATMPHMATKAIYVDGIPHGKDIKAGWENGDRFLALEINGNTVTPVTFTATASKDIKATFTSDGAVAADPSTRWVAVLGEGASFSPAAINCTYSGQDGSLNGLFRSDFVTASSTGETPDFDYSGGRHLSYLLRISMPEGVGIIEFNTCAGGYEWSVDSDGSVSGGSMDWRPGAVKTVELSGETRAGEIVYLEVPAADYTETGLIVTVMSKDMTRSQGKVLSEDLSAKGGHAGTFDMSTLTLIDRELPENAFDFGSESQATIKYINDGSYSSLDDTYSFSSRPKWSTFNLGASAEPEKAEDFNGMYFAWGETEQKESYSWDNYKHSDDHGSIGYERCHTGDAAGILRFSNISGTKHDPARVKWGCRWRMPFVEELLGLIGSNESLDCESGVRKNTGSRYSTVDVKAYNGLDVSGRTFTRNGRTLFLPFAGRFFYNDGSEATEISHEGKVGYYMSGTHCTTHGSRTAYKMTVRGNLVEVNAWETGYGLPVRPVLAEDTDLPAKPAKVRGKVIDSVTNSGIEGVTVSDGYSCCKTAQDGSYTLEADLRARSINITVPATCEIPLGSDGRPEFYKKIKLDGADLENVDFTLTPKRNPGNRFTLIAVSDAHVQNTSNLAQFRTSMADVQATVDRLEAEGGAGEIIGLALGDQMWDNMAMAAEVRKEYTCVKRASDSTMPFFYCIGNHDHDSEAGSTDILSTAVFVDNFSPTDYSFEIGNAHIIVMDDIDFNGSIESSSGGHNKINYRERITGEQLQWLKQDIACTADKTSKVGIFCTHAPVYNGLGNSDAIRSLMAQFSEAHIFSGHIHNLTNFYAGSFKSRSGKVIVEHNIQSLCGMWWLADLSPNGTPAGYGVYTFDGATLAREYNKTSKEDISFQMRAYSGNDSYDSYSWDADYRGKILLRIWDGDAPSQPADDSSWSVKFILNGTSTDMTKVTVPIVDKCAAGYIVRKLGSPHGTGGNATSCTWWTVDVPGGDPALLKGWKIVAVHRLPGGWEETYTTSGLVRNYNGYACGSHFDIFDQNPETPHEGGNEGSSTAPSIKEDK